MSIDDTESKLICEFLEGVASRTSSEFQMESTPFGSLSGNEGDVLQSIVLPRWLKFSSSMIIYSLLWYVYCIAMNIY